MKIPVQSRMMSVLKCSRAYQYEIVNNKTEHKNSAEHGWKGQRLLQLEAVQGFRDLPDVQVLKDRIKW